MHTFKVPEDSYQHGQSLLTALLQTFFTGFGCHVIRPCFICCNNALQSLLSLYDSVSNVYWSVFCVWGPFAPTVHRLFCNSIVQTMLYTLHSKTRNSWAVTLLCLSSLKRTPAWHAVSSMVVDITVNPAACQHVSCHWRHFTAELFSLISMPVKVQLLCHLWDSLAHRVHTLFSNSAGGEHCTLHREMSRSWATFISLMHLSSLITGICMTRVVICLGVQIVTCCPHVLPWLKALHHIHTVSVTLHVFHIPSLTGNEFWQCKMFHMHKLKNTVYFPHFTLFPGALLSLNWLHGDATQHSLMAVRSTPDCRTVTFTVG